MCRYRSRHRRCCYRLYIPIKDNYRSSFVTVLSTVVFTLLRGDLYERLYGKYAVKGAGNEVEVNKVLSHVFVMVVLLYHYYYGSTLSLSLSFYAFSSVLFLLLSLLLIILLSLFIYELYKELFVVSLLLTLRQQERPLTPLALATSFECTRCTISEVDKPSFGTVKLLL